MCGTVQVVVLDLISFDFARALKRDMLMRQEL
jgi:hypothetical protein